MTTQKDMEKRNRKKISAKMLAICALMAAFIAVCAQIEIPLPVIPITLGLFGIFLASILLGPVYGTLSVVLYILLGSLGLPVFAGFKGSITVLFGNTGGYIFGYVFVAVIAGLFAEKIGMKFLWLAAGLLLGTFVCYFFGTLWYMCLSGNSLKISLIYCVIPFIPGDLVKIAGAALIAPRLKKELNRLL